jgi:hypothetical protein
MLPTTISTAVTAASIAAHPGQPTPTPTPFQRIQEMARCIAEGCEDPRLDLDADGHLSVSDLLIAARTTDRTPARAHRHTSPSKRSQSPASLFPPLPPLLSDDILVSDVADLDGDGTDDLMLGLDPAGLRVQLRPANAPSTNLDFAPGEVIRQLHTLDINGDTRPDIYYNAQPGHPVFLVNDGTGGFIEYSQSLPGLGASSDVAIGDVTGDGLDDLVAMSAVGNQIRTFRGIIGGTLFTTSPGVLHFSLSDPLLLELDDLDDDGDLDLLIYNYVAATANNEIIAAFNPGDGSFSAFNWIVTTIPFRASKFVFHDLDEDGHLDAILFARGAGPVAMIHYGLGGGTFGSPVTIPNPTMFDATRTGDIGDFNADGLLDIAFSVEEHAAAAIAFATGPRSFADPVFFAAGANDKTLIAFDADSDGDDDLATSPGLTLLPNDQSAMFPFGTPIYPVPETIAIPATGDFTGDGLPDVAVSTAQPTAVLVFPGEPTGTLGAPIRSEGFDFTDDDRIVADFDADGDPDIAYFDNARRQVTFASSNGTGSLALAAVLPLPGDFDSTETADLNADGLIDFVSIDREDRTVTALFNRGGFAFDAVPIDTGIPFSGRYINDVALLDLNDDDAPDMLITRSRNLPRVTLLNDGTGQFAPTERIVTTPTNPKWQIDTQFENEGRAWPTDLDEDGHPDLLYELSGGLRFQFGLGNGQFAPPIVLQGGLREFAVPRFEDIDLDGFRDIVIVRPLSADTSVFVWFGRPGQSLDAQFPYAVHPHIGTGTLADMDGDGDLDIVARIARFGPNAIIVIPNRAVP